MEGVELELERRSKFLNSLIQQKKKAKEEQEQKDEFNVRVRASDMPLSVQNRAFSLSDFDSAYGPAWHCIVGTSFGSYVTHSVGGFIYFQIDKVYVLLFKTAVEPLDHQ
ncbi:Dynein light chain type 1 family protein [Raphanus sativus]|nr:Dynein light chain type 1 family protein [Raphanus sativus]